MAWNFKHTVESRVNRDFAWQFWTDVDNWLLDGSVESVHLDGPFASGTKGSTRPRGQNPIEWQLAEVDDRSRAIIEVVLQGARIACTWSFADVPGGGVKLTQQVDLEGDRAADYVEGLKELEHGIPLGMKKLAEEMERAAEGRT
jgi:hypothetical protein